jgi:hypothetical protein
VAKATKQHVFNKVLPHQYICSDFPTTFFKGFFSCNACDDWRLRAVHGRHNKKAAKHVDLVSDRLECKRIKRGKKLIQIRVLVGSNLSNEPAGSSVSNEVPASDGNVSSGADRKAIAKAADNARKDKAAAELREKLAKMKADREKKNIDEFVVWNPLETFNRSLFLELQAEKKKNLVLQSTLNVDERLRVQSNEALKEERLENKKLCDMLCYYKNRLKSMMEKRVSFTATNDGTGAKVKSFDSLVQRIEDAFGIMKGAHGEKEQQSYLS